MTTEQHKLSTMPYQFGNVSDDWRPNNKAWEKTFEPKVSVKEQYHAHVYKPSVRGKSVRINRRKNDNPIAKLELGEFKNIPYISTKEQRTMLNYLYAQRRHYGKEFEYHSRKGIFYVKRIK